LSLASIATWQLHARSEMALGRRHRGSTCNCRVGCRPAPRFARESESVDFSDAVGDQNLHHKTRFSKSHRLGRPALALDRYPRLRRLQSGAWNALAFRCYYKCRYGGGDKSLIQRAEEAAGRALAIDPNLISAGTFLRHAAGLCRRSARGRNRGACQCRTAPARPRNELCVSTRADGSCKVRTSLGLTLVSIQRSCCSFLRDRQAWGGAPRGTTPVSPVFVGLNSCLWINLQLHSCAVARPNVFPHCP
jgi:hypothetical protein